MAEAKAWVLDEVYSDLEAPGGEKKIYKIAKKMNKATKDLTHIKQMKSEDGEVLTDESKTKEKWEKYFEQLLNEENQRVVVGDYSQDVENDGDDSRRKLKYRIKW